MSAGAIAVILAACVVVAVIFFFLGRRSGREEAAEGGAPADGAEPRHSSEAERSLRATETMLALVLDAIPARVFWKDRDLRFLGCNRLFAKDAGLASPEEIVGRRDEELVWADQAERYNADDMEVIRTGKPKLGIEEPQDSSEGRIWLETNKLPLTNGDGEIIGVLGTYRDVTDRKRDQSERARLETQLRHSQKMDAVGQLAGGVAHDFNNLLTSIIGNLSLARDDLARGDDPSPLLDEIRRAAEQAATLTRGLLAFSRKQVLDPVVVDLNASLTELSQVLERTLGETITLECKPAEGLGHVRVDPGQIEQVLLNLVVNARDAMPDGGALVIETANVDLSEDYVATHLEARPGPHIMLAVSDTGTGMNVATASRIFEPFFTTKPKGAGTGLGLAMVYGIVKQHQGSIEVYSEPKRGTTIKIYLPRVDAPLDDVRERPSETALPTGSETVLIVEDEPLLRELAVRVLERQGYTALAVPDGEAALALFDMHEGKIDLLLTDVVMPGISGRELAEQLCRKQSSLRVLYTSGYTDNVIVHHGVLDPGLDFLGKPFTVRELAWRVRQALDRGFRQA